MDALTELLHEAAEELPDSLPAADRVRRSAEHARRTRRVVAGVAAAGLLAVTAFGVGVLGGGGRSELAPAVPASRVWAPPVGSVFTADPVMPKAGWVAMARGEWGQLRSLDAPQAHALNDDKGIDMTGNMPRPLACITDPYTLGAEEAHGAALLQPRNHVDAVPLSGRVNEYVLWFAEPSDAERAFAQLRAGLPGLPHPAGPHVSHRDLLPGLRPGGRTRRSRNRSPGRSPESPGTVGPMAYRNGLSAARIGSLVVVHEWLGAPPTRPALTLYALTMYAQNRLSPRTQPPSRSARPRLQLRPRSAPTGPSLSPMSREQPEEGEDDVT